MTDYGITTGYYYLEPNNDFGIYRLDIEKVTKKSFDCFIEKYLPNQTWKTLPIGKKKFYFAKGKDGISYPNLTIPLLEGDDLQDFDGKYWFAFEELYNEEQIQMSTPFPTQS